MAPARRYQAPEGSAAPAALARETDEERLSTLDTTQTATLRTGPRRIADSTGLTCTKLTQS
jgi:hypothetical protein